ncbi:MAG: lipoprotein-releasing ABC transporter permease subunit [Chromatiaceae bacterium]|nr:lipoprotein-releasing ABC transporter permease subunit [Gammaproteobacteria bacterium]MCP5315693.1 lipoprotein-releasing ABC transporter permease subunit [Chromatiaceae bacterium]
MYHPLSLFVGLRYTRSRRRNHFISFISLISTLGIALGVVVLITVLSVMNGFHKEVRERILGMASHGDVQALDGRMTDWREAMAQARRNPRVLGAAPYIEGQAMLSHRREVTGALIRGVDPALESEVVDVGAHMVSGSLSDLQPGEFRIILGRELAGVLGVNIGDKVTVIVPQISVTVAGSMPRLKRFTVSGLFEVGMGEYDRGVAIVHIKDAAVLQQLDNAVTGVRLRIDDVWQAREVALELAESLQGRYRVLNWTDYHRNFFAALKMEKRMMGLLLFFIVVIAAFNIVSTLVMMVVDKQSDIAILKTFGASPGQVMRIFIVQGATLGAIGTLIGVVAGLALALNIEGAVAAVERTFGVQFIDPSVYYIAKLPSDVQWLDVLLVGAGSFLLSLLMTLPPAMRAYRTQPAEALRYE